MHSISGCGMASCPGMRGRAAQPAGRGEISSISAASEGNVPSEGAHGGDEFFFALGPAIVEDGRIRAAHECAELRRAGE